MAVTLFYSSAFGIGNTARPRFSTSEHHSTSGILCESFPWRRVAAGKAAQGERPLSALISLGQGVCRGFGVTAAQFEMLVQLFPFDQAEQYSYFGPLPMQE